MIGHGQQLAGREFLAAGDKVALGAVGFMMGLVEKLLLVLISDYDGTLQEETAP
jgi:hypothetical protein